MKRYAVEYSAAYDGGIFRSSLAIYLNGDLKPHGDLNKIDQECKKVLGKLGIDDVFVNIDSIELEGELD